MHAAASYQGFFRGGAGKTFKTMLPKDVLGSGTMFLHFDDADFKAVRGETTHMRPELVDGYLRMVVVSNAA